MLEALAFTGVMLIHRHDLASFFVSISDNDTLGANS